MAEDPAAKVLERYAQRYVDHVGKLPRRKDLDPTLARTLIWFAGDTETAIRVVDMWFADPWCAREGFAFDRWWVVFNRLVGTGQIQVQARGTPEQHEAAQKLAAILVRGSHLRLVTPTKTEDTS